MSGAQLERLAELLHEGWMRHKAGQGVVYGPERSDTTHPHLVAWDKLDKGSQNQDRFIASIVLRDWSRGGVAAADLPALIHNAWAEWQSAEDASNPDATPHPHARPFHEVHGQDAGEHVIQADLIAAELGKAASAPTPLDTRRNCLVLLPLRERTIEVYDKVLAPTIRSAGYSDVRADLLRGSQTIHEDVVDQLERASVVIADLTEDNPNVNYEIGLTRALGRPIIMIAEQRPHDAVPFYYKGQRIQFYDRSTADWQRTLADDVGRALRAAVRTDPLSENQRIGLTGFYAQDNYGLESALLREIGRAKKRIVAIGMGLAILNSQRRELMEALRRRVLEEEGLSIHIILAQADHPGLLARIEEERKHQPKTGIIDDWAKSFFTFAQELPESLGGWPRERVHVRRLPYLPTAMVIQIDDVYFFRCYGPPNQGGWACPWLRCEGTLSSLHWRMFLENMVTEAVRNCVPE